ncbi:MAG: cell wall metabolism sensor histidine kinase WalK [Acidobacteria bacterium]|nr:cell wall metabolism sensor histidine kinase WalK [Acidobacteriota bacterium]
MLPREILIEELDPATASDADLAGLHAVDEAVDRDALPDEPTMPRGQAMREYRWAPTYRRRRWWVARHAGDVVGRAGCAYDEVPDNRDHAQVEIRVVPLGGHSGIAAVALVIDVTQIEMLARMRRDFVADFSHEVRTPLAGLRSSVETLHEGSLQREQEEQLHRILDRQLGRLERLVADLAELNSIESGETILHREPTPIVQMLRELSLDFSERAGSRDIVITVDGPESVAWVDPIRIEQVFSNLIDNAIKHAPASDEVRIEVRDEQAMSEVRVSDRGPGIPREERDKVFHRFYRMDKSRSSQSAGTGLGLAITKHLVLQHGGSIGVESAPGSGTTMVVKLPKHEVV